MEQITILNERFIDIPKSKISANLFAAYIDGKISFEDFVSLNISLDQIHPSSFDFLEEMSGIKFKINQDYKGGSRKWDAEALLLSSGLASETSPFAHGFRITEEGKKLFEIGIQPLLKH